MKKPSKQLKALKAVYQNRGKKQTRDLLKELMTSAVSSNEYESWPAGQKAEAVILYTDLMKVLS